MGKWDDLAFDTVKEIVTSIKQAAAFLIGFVVMAVVTLCGVAPAVLHELIKYKDIPVDYMQIALLVVPQFAIAIPAYIMHGKMVEKALATVPPEKP